MLLEMMKKVGQKLYRQKRLPLDFFGLSHSQERGLFLANCRSE